MIFSIAISKEITQKMSTAIVAHGAIPVLSIITFIIRPTFELV